MGNNSESSSELGEFAIRMERAVDRFIGNPDASQSFVEVSFAADSSVGEYPQAALDQSCVYLEDDGDPYLDRFPKSVLEPIQLKLRAKAKWTDVLSSDLWSEGFLLSELALSAFAPFALGNTKNYSAEVCRRKERRAYWYVFTANHITPEDIDFKKSEFYVADMIGTPKELIEVKSAAEFDRKRELISQGELEGVKRFSRLQFKSVRLKPKRAPRAAVFGLGTFSPIMYMRRELCDALRRAGVTGLEFKRNNLIFAD